MYISYNYVLIPLKTQLTNQTWLYKRINRKQRMRLMTFKKHSFGQQFKLVA